jgi:ABC-type molybdate transport system substrate-binding protein
MQSPQVHLFSTLAVRKAFDDSILPEFQSATGVRVEAKFDPTTVLLESLASGANPDVIVAVSGSLDELRASGTLAVATETELVRVGVGMACAPGETPPDISSVDALKSALLNARVAYSRTGASGIYFARLIDELGIADEVNSRAVVIDKGFIAEAVVDGRADLAIQQTSELVFVPAAKIVGPLPAGAQNYTTFSVTLTASGAQNFSAVDFYAALQSDASHEAYLATGLELVSRV